MRVGVISGKGGVGKTTIACSLALSLAEKGFNVGILDSDLTGANIPDILGKSVLAVVDDRFIPSVSRGVKYVSLGQIASENDPVLWSGKNLASASKQLLERTEWKELDYLVVDFPPGSGSEVQALLPLMDQVLIVTIPSVLAKSNVRRIIEMCREVQVSITGLIKNMTTFVCSNCGWSHDIFPEDHSFEDIGVPTIAEIPLNPEYSEAKVINEFPIEGVLKAMTKPVLLKKREKKLRKFLLKRILRLK